MSTNKMWGGRFESGPSNIMKEITPSIDFDKRLWRQDIAGSRAQAKMLAAQKIVSDADRDAILSGLDRIEKEIDAGTFVFKRELEDIHLNIESRLGEIAGDAAGRLHTARSRNTWWRRISGCGCVTPAPMPMSVWPRFNARFSHRPKLMPIPSCPASPICSRRSRSPSGIIALPMWRCSRATVDASPTHLRD